MFLSVLQLKDDKLKTYDFVRPFIVELRRVQKLA